MKVLAVPFDLRLWTGVDDDAPLDEEVFLRFIKRRNLIQTLNRQLLAGTIPDCRLRIPLSQRLYERLSNVPAWSEIRKGTPLHRLKRDVLALLRNKQAAAGLTLYLEMGEVVHLYSWEEPDDFFPPPLNMMEEDWVEMVGVCTFENEVDARHFGQPLPVLGRGIVTSLSQAQEARLTRRPIDAADVEERRIPLLFQSDSWTWERWVRRILWDDERLPFQPVGYCPPEHWQTGQRPSHYGYRDRWGGTWDWEGGRALSEQNPFGGHWNVQLPDTSVAHRWIRWIEACTHRRVCSQPATVSHINVEPDGCITDLTFEWCV